VRLECVVVQAEQAASDPLALPAFIISIVAAGVGLSALLWNIIAWVRSGHRIVVEIETVVRNPKRNSGWTGRRGRFGWAAASIPPSHVPYSIVFIGLTARNVGRAPVDIERFYFTVGKPREDKNMSWTFEGDPPLPQRLEPGSSASREYMIGGIEAFTRREHRRRFRGAVALGNGQSRRSRLSFDIDRPNRGSEFLSSSAGKTLQTSAPKEDEQ